MVVSMVVSTKGHMALSTGMKGAITLEGASITAEGAIIMEMEGAVSAVGNKTYNVVGFHQTFVSLVGIATIALVVALLLAAHLLVVTNNALLLGLAVAIDVVVHAPSNVAMMDPVVHPLLSLIMLWLCFSIVER